MVVSRGAVKCWFANSECACRLTAALQESVGSREKSNGGHTMLNGGGLRRGSVPVTAVDLGFAMQGANHSGGWL
jgi:hypothetical protein